MTAGSTLRPRLAALALVWVSVMGGCGDDDSVGLPVDAAPSDGIPPIDAAPREVVTATQSLLPGELVEGVMTGGPSDHAVIRLIAPVMELDWNIHGHANGATQTVFEQLNQLTVDYGFTPTAQSDWWLLLRNSGPASMDVQVRIELHGNLQWRWE